MKPLIYGLSVSLFVRKVRFLLEYKGIDYDLDPVVPMNPPDGFRKISPIGKIPALKLGEFTIADSSVICQYLDKKFTEKSLSPENPENFAKSLWFDEYSDTKMTQTISAIFFEKFGKPLLLQMAPDEERVAELEKEVPEVLDYLNSELEGSSFLSGESISLGDLGVISNLYNHVTSGYVIDNERWPNLSAYYEKVIKLPFIESVIAKERQEVPLPAL